MLSESQSHDTECLQRGWESRLECWRTFIVGKWSGEEELEKGKERKWEKKRKGVKLRWHEGERERER